MSPRIATQDPENDVSRVIRYGRDACLCCEGVCRDLTETSQAGALFGPDVASETDISTFMMDLNERVSPGHSDRGT